jgi:hypothetical protein
MNIYKGKNSTSSSKRIATGKEGRGKTGAGYLIFGDYNQ